MADVLLWHFPISHFNEKVRWTLDFKRIPHRRRALGPDYLFRAWWATGRATLPILFIGKRAIGDSTRIIAALEERYPDPPLYPDDPAQRERALELEDLFDEQLAPHVRRLVWLETSREPRTFLPTAMPDTPRVVHAAMRPAVSVTSWIVRRRYGVDDASGPEARERVRAAMERLQAELGPRDYLVGNAFGVADLTAASLFAPLIQPPERPYPPVVAFPAPLRAFQDELAAMPGAAWVREMYRRHRGAWIQPER